MATVLERVEHESDWGRWSLVRARPSPALRGVAIEYQGYRETCGRAVVRREAPAMVVPVILVLGGGFRLAGVDGWRSLRRSFVAGLHERSVLVGSDGDAWCLQIDLTPPGARRVFGLDLDDLRNRVVDLADVLGPEAERLADRLAGAPGWAARFAWLDGWLADRAGRGPRVATEIEAAWALMRRTGGAVPVSALAARAGLSRQAFGARFAREIGLSPKRAALVLRFERAMALLAAGETPLAEVALAAGYYDQAHFNRDFRAFSGASPQRVRGALLADGTGQMATD